MRGKWTAGPWFMSGVRQKVGGADTHSVVATVDGKEIIIASVWYNPITHEGFHDARLIAAAPALYEALVNRTVALEFIAGRRGGEQARKFREQAARNHAALSQALPPKGEE